MTLNSTYTIVLKLSSFMKSWFFNNFISFIEQLNFNFDYLVLKRKFKLKLVKFNWNWFISSVWIFFGQLKINKNFITRIWSNPIKIKKFTFLKSAFVHSKARSQYEIRFSSKDFQLNFNNKKAYYLFNIYILKWLKQHFLKNSALKIKQRFYYFLKYDFNSK